MRKHPLFAPSLLLAVFVTASCGDPGYEPDPAVDRPVSNPGDRAAPSPGADGNEPTVIPNDVGNGAAGDSEDSQNLEPVSPEPAEMPPTTDGLVPLGSDARFRDDLGRLAGTEITRTRPLPSVDPGLLVSSPDGEDPPNEDGGFHISLPERFVMASIPNATPGLPYPTLEVRVSPDGERWSAPSYPLTSSCGVPIPVDWNIAPGLAANANHYLVAAYGANGHLYFSKSRNGVEWQTALGTTSAEPGLTSESRPSVVYDYDERVWYALMVTESSIPGKHSVSFMDLDGVTTQFARVPLVGFDSVRSPSIVHTGIPDKRYIASRSFRGGGVGQPPEMSFRFYESLPFGFIVNSYPSFHQGLSFETSAASTLSGKLTQVFLATSHDVQAASRNGEPLSTGLNRVWELDPSTDEWSLSFELGDAAPGHEGPSLAGVGTNMVVGSPGPSGTTDVWHVWEDELGILRAQHRDVGTRSIKQVGLAFGPRNGRTELPNVCSGGGDPDEDPLKHVFLRFRWFKRTIPPSLGDFDDSEDVVLAVAHETQTGYIDRRSVIGFVGEATKNQGHDFNEGNRSDDLPSLEILMQPNEVVTVTLKGDDGPSTVSLTYEELAASQPGGNAKVAHTRDAAGTPMYQLRYDASVTSAQ